MSNELTNDISSRVEIIKHLQNFIDTTIFDEDGPVAIYLEEKFKSFAKNELAILLGMASPVVNANSFTPEQIIALKLFADKIIGGRSVEPNTKSPAESSESPSDNVVSNNKNVGVSSNGRTRDSDSRYLGSNPGLPTNTPESIQDFANKLAKSKSLDAHPPKSTTKKNKSKQVSKPEPKQALVSLKNQSGLQRLKAKKSLEKIEPVESLLPTRKKTGKIVEVDLVDLEGKTVHIKKELEDHSQVKPLDPNIMKPMPGKHEFETVVNANAAQNAAYNQSFATQKLAMESGAAVGVAISAIQNRIELGQARSVQED